MARIRSIKPEFWDSPDTIRASLRARLLYIAMWNWADDYGIGDANLGRLINFAFPGDELSAADFPTLAAEVSDVFGVTFYAHRGRPYYCIPAWEKHQRTEKKARQLVPFPADAEPAPDQGRGSSDDSGGSSDASRGSSVPGTRGTRGTGEQGEQGEQAADAEAPPKRTDLALIPQTDAPMKAGQYADRFEDFWAAYPRHEGKRNAAAAWQRATKRASEQEILRGAIRYRDDPNRDDAYTAHATTWLNRDGWDDAPLPKRRPETQYERLQANAEATHEALARMGIA